MDEEFREPRLAAVYDALAGERRDLDLYTGLAQRVGARSVLDLGCGTGVLALRLAGLGLDVVGVDPAAASLDVARAKPGAEAVRWVLGDVAAVAGLRCDLVVMTGNAAMAVTDDRDWRALLAAVHAVLEPGGRVVLESRDPAARAWERWDRARTETVTRVAGVGAVTTWTELVEVRLPLVRFRSTWAFAADGAVLTSESVLRVRSRAELVADLADAGLAVAEVLDAPDRPGLELVVVARRS